MYKYLLLLFLLSGTFIGKAQNRSNLTGKVVDSLSAAPVELATVAVLNPKDTLSSLISYTLSDKNGVFTLHNLPSGISLKVLITFVGYMPYRKTLTLVKGVNVDLGKIVLNPRQLKEIAITGERVPIVIRKDTIEFNAEAFKTRPNAVVEELLKKLPGVEVDNKGTITVNGKSVSKIMIDGKEFFANDPKIATKNLDASLIDKVQVYDDRENDPDHLIEDSKVDKIINLKFKKALKKSIFGKVYAGAGTQGRFEAGGLYNIFRDTLQISLIGVGNNLNKTGFSREDLYEAGGFNRSGDNVLNQGTTFGGSSYGGIQSVATGGFNINNDYGKKLKLNLVYFYSRTQTINNNQSNNQQFFPKDTLTTQSVYSSKATDNKHNLSFSLKWQADTATQIKYNPLLSISNSQTTGNSIADRNSYLIPRISHNTNVSDYESNSVQFQHSFSYYRRLKKKFESITITHNLNINPGVTNNHYGNDLISFTPTQPSDSLTRYAQRNSKNTTASLNVSYRYPFTKKLIADIGVSGNYSQQGGNLFTYDFNPASNQYSIYIDSLSTDATRYQKTEGIRPGFTYNITKKTSLIVGLTAQWQQIKNQFNKNISDLDQNYLFFLPSVQLRTGDISLGYDVSVSQPSISDLQPIKLVSSSLYTFTGNPDLKPTRRNNFNANYYKYNPESRVNLRFNISGTIEQNSIYRQRTISTLGAQTSRPINRDGQYNMYAGAGYGKSFKKNHELTFSTSGGFYGNMNHRFFQLNADEGYQTNYYLGLYQNFSLNWNDKLELEPSYSISRNITQYTRVNYSGLSYTTHSIDSRLTAHLPQKIDLEGSYNYTYNPLVSDGFQRSINLVSMTVARQLLKKDRGEIKLSCYDIFNQNVNAYRYANENSITDSQSQILKRYFLLTLQFKFNKTITK
ncbi:MAG: TonB-dependent receptor [Mucilaginibacter sp.]|uniref:TonB-dependent receptor n=1 Tax=Mucilaginibacter sp. TaxID=1882438 RepID=UPI003267AF66